MGNWRYKHYHLGPQSQCIELKFRFCEMWRQSQVSDPMDEMDEMDEMNAFISSTIDHVISNTSEKVFNVLRGSIIFLVLALY